MIPSLPISETSNMFANNRLTSGAFGGISGAFGGARQALGGARQAFGGSLVSGSAGNTFKGDPGDDMRTPPVGGTSLGRGGGGGNSGGIVATITGLGGNPEPGGNSNIGKPVAVEEREEDNKPKSMLGTAMGRLTSQI